MLQYEEALARVLAAVPPPTTELVPLSEAHHRVLAQAVPAPIPLPAFDNSAMDGYAVRAEDVATASPERPVRLQVIGRTAAGEVFPNSLSPGTCVRLFTGSGLPRGADAVVMQEDTRTEPEVADQVLVLEPVKPWENTRLSGEDISKGGSAAAPGKPLTWGHLSLLAALGVAHVQVGRRPRVGILATGSELSETGVPLRPGQIYESNRLALSLLAREAGSIPHVLPLIPDALSATREALLNAFDECEVLVTSGGVSVGEMDFIKPAFESAGGTLNFWKVAIKPGRPFVCGTWNEKLLFGVPGNPVSALVTFLLLVRPALLRWQGASDTALPAVAGELAEPLINDGARRHFWRVTLDSDGKVRSAGVQASHILTSLAQANGLVDVPPATTLPTGSKVRVLLI